MATLDDDFLEATLLEPFHEIAENDFFLQRLSRDAHHINGQNHGQAGDHPEKEVLTSGIHPAFLHQDVRRKPRTGGSPTSTSEDRTTHPAILLPLGWRTLSFIHYQFSIQP